MKNFTLLAVSVACHDGSICLLKNGEILFFIQEERSSGLKHDSYLPFKSLNLIKDYVDEIDLLVVVNYPDSHTSNCIVKSLEKDKIKIKEIVLDDNNHHVYHASSAFYGSGFSDAICLVIDGWGAEYGTEKGTGLVETTTIYKCNYPSNFEVIYKNLSYDPQKCDSFDSNETENEYKNNFDCDIASQFDIGVMYGVMTDIVINASAYDSGKLMGLSSYGKEDASVPPMLFEDTLFANANLFKNDRLLNTKNYPQAKDFDTFEKKANYAYAVQKALEKVFVHRIKYILKKFPDNKNIVFSGGCALNILGNSLIKENFPDINFYVDPIANDACQSYGAAMYYHHIRTNDMKPKKIKNLYWGPKYDVNILEKILELEIFKINHKNAS